MSRLIFLKLGGSLITDKTREATARPEIIHAMAREVRAALAEDPEVRLIVGHGSGSYGHFVARRYNVRQGCADRWGYALTGAAAARLNRLVVDIFIEEEVPVVSFQPSASIRCVGGELLQMSVDPIRAALSYDLVPMIYGDVCFDQMQGSTIASTEEIMVFLAARLHPKRVILAGEVEGVFTADPRQVPEAELIRDIAPNELDQLKGMLSGSHGVDVTGGMLTKVLTMGRLAQQEPGLAVHLVSGLNRGDVHRALLGQRCDRDTLIHR